MAPLSLPGTMPAVRLHGPYDLRVDQVPTPDLPGPAQVRIRVTATGIGGSDLHTYNSMLKLSVLDVLFGGGVAVSSDPAPDSAIAPSCFGGVQVISRIRGN